MPRAFGFDGDSAYYESLAAKVRADEAAKKAATIEAARERRRSMGLPEDEHMSRKDRKAVEKVDPDRKQRKKSVGEKIANFVFNAGRPEKIEQRQVERIGVADGEIRKRPKADVQ